MTDAPPLEHVAPGRIARLLRVLRLDRFDPETAARKAGAKTVVHGPDCSYAIGFASREDAVAFAALCRRHGFHAAASRPIARTADVRYRRDGPFGVPQN